MIVKLNCSEPLRENLEGNQEKKDLLHIINNKKIRIRADLLSATMQSIKQWSDNFKLLKEKTLST